MRNDIDDAQRRRWMRPNAHLYMRPDAARYLRQDYERFLPPGALATKANFDPNQPRDEIGRWTDAGGVGAGGEDAGEGGGGPLAETPSEIATTYLAGLVPRIPGQRPPTSWERTAVMRVVAGYIAEKGLEASDLIARTSWLYHALPSISSYLDAPKSLGELQADLSPKAGYDVHHIVERASAREDGYSRFRVDDPDNLVCIPRMKHWEVNGWYSSKNEDFGNQSPRDNLHGKDWDERRRVGLYALEKYGVLKR